MNTNVASGTVAASLKVLLNAFIDYAGIYPPAAVSVSTAVENFNKYESSDQAWMLHWLVVGESDLDKVPASLDGCLAVLKETDEARAASLETKKIVKVERPVYCEVAVNNLSELEKVKEANCFAKIRTGGLKPEAIPSTKEVAAFINKCSELRLPFKATAGLHHPIRSQQPLTYEPDAPQAVMHGFINVLLAAAFAWKGDRDIEPIISETDPQAFSFAEDSASYRGKSLTIAQIEEARKSFIHSVGSCSFDEPVHDLKKLGWL